MSKVFHSYFMNYSIPVIDNFQITTFCVLWYFLQNIFSAVIKARKVLLQGTNRYLLTEIRRYWRSFKVKREWNFYKIHAYSFSITTSCAWHLLLTVSCITGHFTRPKHLSISRSVHTKPEEFEN